MKLSKAFEGYRIARLSEGYSRDTVERYRYCLGLLITYKNDPHIEEITPQDLQAFFYWLRTEYTPVRSGGDDTPLASSSLYAVWKAVRSLYNWAEKELGVDRPDSELPAPKHTHREIIPFTQEEVKALLAACEFTRTSAGKKTYKQRRPTARRDRALLLFLLDTGLRVSELARLNVEDITLETGEVTVKPYGAGRKTRGRVVYIGKAARKAYWRYLVEREASGSAFLTAAGLPMNRHSIQALVRRLGERAGVKRVHPHRFRHTMATMFLKNGGSTLALQRLLGHRSLEMVKRYAWIAQADLEAAHGQSSPVDNWRL